MKRSLILERLEELVNEEHCCNCDDTTCSIRVAFNNGQTMHAVKEFWDTGAASDRFNKLMEILLSLKSRRMWFNTQLNKENKELLKVSHAECECGAVVWELEWNDAYCSSCGGKAKAEGK
jgi:hypothetical protein